MKVIIIGAGLCGLSLAKKLSSHAITSTLYEKSRGVGGRWATRRFETDKMDHGSQVYQLEAPLHDLHSHWLSHNLVKPWPEPTNTFTSSLGMTTLAKSLADQMDIHLNEKVIKIETQEKKILITCESQKQDDCDQLVITSPVPQSLALLDSGGFTYAQPLKEVSYYPMIVLFVRHARLKSKEPYLISPSENIYSIADQKSKGLSQAPAWTMTLSPQWSSLHFEKTESEIIEQSNNLVNSYFELESQTQIVVKKWRYAIPHKSYFDKFYKPHPQIYLAGDAFGGQNLQSSILSAQSVEQELLYAKKYF